MGKATEDLRKEHEAILHVLKIVDKMISAEPKEEAIKLQFGNELINFLQIFADKCHHGKEEIYLFVELVNNGVRKEGGPIGVMLQEHNQGREYIALMSKSLEAKDLKEFIIVAEKYRDLLISHIDKENNVLFVTADQILDDLVQDELFEKFEQHEEKIVGHGIHKELHQMIHKWAAEFEVH